MAYLEYHKDTYVPYEKPIKHGRWESVKLTFYDPKERTVLRRTFKSWVGILTFYFVFYGCLAAFYAICMHGLFSTLNTHSPSYILDDSLIGSNPGLGFRPISENVDVDGSLIWYKANNETQCKEWVNRMNNFLEPYMSTQGGGYNQVVCDYNRTPPQNKEVCIVDVQKWAPCNSENGFSYNRSAPCIFLKLNRIYGWSPDYYNHTSDLPDDMPEDLKETIRNTKNAATNTVWLSCHGENPLDTENIGPIEYFPQQGFPGYYYPYYNTPGYLSPLVAIRLSRPKMHVLINVECRAWAKNIKYSNAKGVREGSVHFEVMID